MTKQEEIREGLITKIKSIRAWGGNPDDPLSPEDDVGDILHYLHSQGVVIKVNRGLPDWRDADCIGGGAKLAQQDMLDAGFVATEPLVEVCPQCGIEPHLCKCPTINRGSFAHYLEPLVEE